MEFYAGHAALTKGMRKAGYVSGRFDILYADAKKAGRKTSWMDLLTPSGFARLDEFGCGLSL